MSRENVEIVRLAYAAANRGDWDAAFEDASSNFEWDNSRAIGADNRAVFSVDGIRRYLTSWTKSWESWSFDIGDAIPIGDHVVVPVTTHVRSRLGIDAQARTTHLVTVRHGKVERICLYQDLAEAIEAAQRS